VADFDFVAKFIAKICADFGNDAEAGDAGGFVDEDDLVFWTI